MYRNRITIALFALVALFTAGCGKDWLEVKPTDGVIKERFWNTKEDVYSAIIGCYQGILGITASPGSGSMVPVELMFAWGELRADDLVAGTLEDESLTYVLNGNLLSSSKFCDWASFYTCINYCNQVVYSAPDVQDVDLSFTDSERKAYQGEARAIRSMMYLYLVKVFGDIPMRMVPSESDNQDYVNLVQYTELQAMDTIVKDLLVALNDVPESYGDAAFDKGRITKNTVRAILADAYLWMERYADTKYYCNQIISSNKFSLFDTDQKAIWLSAEPDPGPGNYDLATQRFTVGGSDRTNFRTYLYTTAFSTEVIFELQNPSSRYNPLNRNGSSLMIAESGSNVKLMASPKVCDTQEVFGVESEEDTYATELAASTLVDIRGQYNSYSLVGPGYLVYKYRGSYGGSWYLYRYADVLLMKAEAIAANPESTQSDLREAKGIVEDLRAKRNALCQTYINTEAGGVIDAATLSEFVLAERNRELIFEGKRWFDLVRYARRSEQNMAAVADMLAAQAGPEYSAQLSIRLRNEKAYFWPILKSEIEASNGTLKQNPFYL